MIESAYIDAVQIHRTTVRHLHELAGLGSPSPRAERTENPTEHGDRDDTLWYSSRTINVRGSVYGDSPAAAWAELDTVQGAFLLGATRVLKFERSGLGYSERCYVKVAGEFTPTLRALVRRIPYTVQLLAGDPRIYRDTATTGSYTPSSGGSGVAMPLVFPLVFSGGSGATVDLTNAGTVATPVVWTITGACVGAAVVNETTGERLALKSTAELFAGDVLVLDVAARTCTLNGVSRPDLIDAATARWWQLPAGTSTIRLAYASGTPSLAWSYRSARM